MYIIIVICCTFVCVVRLVLSEMVMILYLVFYLSRSTLCFAISGTRL